MNTRSHRSTFPRCSTNNAPFPFFPYDSGTAAKDKKTFVPSRHILQPCFCGDSHNPVSTFVTKMSVPSSLFQSLCVDTSTLNFVSAPLCWYVKLKPRLKNVLHAELNALHSTRRKRIRLSTLFTRHLGPKFKAALHGHKRYELRNSYSSVSITGHHHPPHVHVILVTKHPKSCIYLTHLPHVDTTPDVSAQHKSDVFKPAHRSE